MKARNGRSSWIALGLFYVVLLLIVFILNYANRLWSLTYLGVQIGLITLGVGILSIVALRTSEKAPAASILLSFTIGVLTIIPAVLLSLGRVPGLWPQYFYIAGGMASGSFLTFLALWYAKRIAERDRSDSN